MSKNVEHSAFETGMDRAFICDAFRGPSASEYKCRLGGSHCYAMCTMNPIVATCAGCFVNNYVCTCRDKYLCLSYSARAETQSAKAQNGVHRAESLDTCVERRIM